MFESGGTRKTGLTGSLSRAPFARSLPHPLPRKKIEFEFGIGGDAISRCLERHTCSFSHFSVDLRYDTIRYDRGVLLGHEHTKAEYSALSSNGRREKINIKKKKLKQTKASAPLIQYRSGSDP